MAKPPYTLPGAKAPHAVSASPAAGVPAVVTKAMDRRGILKRKAKPGGNPATPAGLSNPMSMGKV